GRVQRKENIEEAPSLRGGAADESQIIGREENGSHTPDRISQSCGDRSIDMDPLLPGCGAVGCRRCRRRPRSRRTSNGIPPGFKLGLDPEEIRPEPDKLLV